MTKHSMHGTLLHQRTHDRTLLPIKTGIHCSRIAPVLDWMLLRAKGPYPFSFLLQPNVFLKYTKYVTSFVTGIGYFMVAVQQYCISELWTSWRLFRSPRGAVSSPRVRLSITLILRHIVTLCPAVSSITRFYVFENTVYRSVNPASPLQRPSGLFWE